MSYCVMYRGVYYKNSHILQTKARLELKPQFVFFFCFFFFGPDKLHKLVYALVSPCIKGRSEYYSILF